MSVQRSSNTKNRFLNSDKLPAKLLVSALLGCTVLIIWQVILNRAHFQLTKLNLTEKLTSISNQLQKMASLILT